jgi:hypothetical protein
MQDTTRLAAHLMWLERQLDLHRRWQRWLLFAWIMSISATVLLFMVLLPFLQTALSLPPETVILTAGGVALEFLFLFFLTGRVVLRRRAIEAEISRIMR